MKNNNLCLSGIFEFVKENKKNIILWVLFLFIYSGNSYTSFGTFFAEQFLIMSFMTVGVSIEMLCGNFDLSFAAQIASSTVLAAYFLSKGSPLWAACLLIFVFHALAGALKGFLIAKIHIPAIIMTLALRIIFTDLFAGLTGGNSILFKSETRYYHHFMFEIVIWTTFAVLLIGAFIFLEKTYYGRYCRMLGEDMDLMERSGLNCTAVLIVIHVLASLFFAVPAIIMLLWTSSGSTAMGTNYLYKVLAAACLGGVSYRSGRGKLSGMLAGSVSIIFIVFLLTSSGYLSRLEGIIEGFIILFAVLPKQSEKN